MRIKWWMVLLGVLAVFVAIYLVLVWTAEPAEDHVFLDGDHFVIAHQGGDGLFPSNTMYAFERSADMGVDVLEMDMHSTKDGHLVIMHDDTVDRTTDGTGAIRDLTLAELKQLDAGYNWTDDEGASYPYRDQGITVPTLEELFTAFPSHLMLIEIKQADPSITEPFCQKIKEYSMEDMVMAASFSQEVLDEFREVCPGIATSAGESEVIWFFALSTLFLERVISPESTALQVPEYQGPLKVLTNRFVDAAHNRNLEVHAWTINEEEDMERLIELGLDGIITDFPDRLLSVLEN